MSNKVVVLKRNHNDGAKWTALNGIMPSHFLEYTSRSQLASLRTDLGTRDYLLVTGGHGDFQNGKPSKFNDATIKDAMTWVKGIQGRFKAVILDTCFSAALAGAFLPLIPNGGCLVCAYGTGEGWADGFSVQNQSRTVGAVLGDVVTNFQSLTGSWSSIAVAIKKPTNQLLHTGNAGAGRKAGLQAREGIGMETDTEEELRQMDFYLARDRISVVEATPDALRTMLADNLAMMVV